MIDFGGMGYNSLQALDDNVVPDLEQAPKKVSPLEEIGATGVKRAAGIIDEEFLPALRGRKAIKVFREMSMNDPTVGALLFAIDKLVRQVTWRVETPDNTPGSTEASDFVESCMDDMSHTWNDMISEILSMLVYGFSWHEVVYKKRVGPWEKDPKKKSKYADNKIGWRKIPIRSQETLLRWIFDEHGGVQAFVQMSPPLYTTNVLSIQRSLLFRTGQYKGNPEGVSLLRTAYRPWFFKKRLEEFEAIGVERDLAGLPVAWVPADYMQAADGSREQKVYTAFKKMVQNIRRDEHDGLVLPNQYDPETKQKLFEFELMASGGARSFDTNTLIQRYKQDMLMMCLADFILLGHEDTGSYAMHVDKTGIFKAALNVVTEAIADVFNRHAIPRLFELNAWKLDELPKLVPNNVDPPNLTELGTFMGSMGGLGMQFFPDPELEKFLRDVAQLPELPDEVIELQRHMAMQDKAMQYNQQSMEARGQADKLGMVMGGHMTPEQADLAAQSPSPQMQQQSAVGEAVGAARGAMHPDVQAATAQDVANQKDLAIAGKGDPVGEHSRQAAVDEQRAASDHGRALKLADRSDKSDDNKTKNQATLERLKQRGHTQKTNQDMRLQRVKSSAIKKVPPKPKKRK